MIYILKKDNTGKHSITRILIIWCLFSGMSVNIAAILGGTCGALIVVLTLAILAFCCYRFEFFSWGQIYFLVQCCVNCADRNNKVESLADGKTEDKRLMMERDTWTQLAQEKTFHSTVLQEGQHKINQAMNYIFIMKSCEGNLLLVSPHPKKDHWFCLEMWKSYKFNKTRENRIWERYKNDCLISLRTMISLCSLLSIAMRRQIKGFPGMNNRLRKIDGPHILAKKVKPNPDTKPCFLNPWFPLKDLKKKFFRDNNRNWLTDCCKARSDSTCHSAMSSLWWSVCPWQDPQNFSGWSKATQCYQAFLVSFRARVHVQQHHLWILTTFMWATVFAKRKKKGLFHSS